MDEQYILLSIVETWNISEIPEYRGFRCANCQQYRNQAWHHWLHIGGYKLPLHLCNDTCEPQFRRGTLQVDESKKQEVDRSLFGAKYSYTPHAVKRFRRIVSSWPEEREPALYPFHCDDCGSELEVDPLDGIRKGYHVWWKMPDEETLAELHFDKDCAKNLGIT